MARFKIEILESEVGQWKQFNIPATSTGVPTWAVNQVVGAISISDSPTGEDAQPLVNGGTLIAGATIYARANTPTSAVANDFFFKQRLALVGNGGGGGGGSTTYTFNSPLSESGGAVSFAKSTNFITNNANALELAPSVSTDTFIAKENGNGFGAVDIRNQDGYFSISEDGGTAANLLAVLGFVDSTTTFRIRNITGGYITFNHLIQYEGTYSPADDKDLVPLATLNQVKQELLNIIQSLPAGIQWIGEISNTSTEVKAQPQLLTDFVQAQRQRAPQDGDLVRTSDSFGFIYSSSNWVDFGQISISIATTTSAGLMMFGTTDGELQDLGGGKAKVIGWDTVKQALQDLDSRLTNLNNNAVTLTTSQTISGEKTFTTINCSDPTQNTHAANKLYVDTKVQNSTRTFQSTDAITTANLPTGDYGYKLSTL